MKIDKVSRIDGMNTRDMKRSNTILFNESCRCLALWRYYRDNVYNQKLMSVIKASKAEVLLYHDTTRWLRYRLMVPDDLVCRTKNNSYDIMCFAEKMRFATILGEATSSVDTRTEELIKRGPIDRGRTLCHRYHVNYPKCWSDSCHERWQYHWARQSWWLIASKETSTWPL